MSDQLKTSYQAADLSLLDGTEAARLLTIDAYARRQRRSVGVGAMLAAIGVTPARLALAQELRARPGVAFVALVEGWDLQRIHRACY